MLCLLPLASAYPLIYLIGYILSLTPVIFHFYPTRAVSAKRLNLLSRSAAPQKTSVIAVLFNLSGLPPFGGFFIKVMALAFLANAGHWVTCLSLAAARILTLSAYAGILFILAINGISTSTPKSILRNALGYTFLSVPIMASLPYLIPLFS